MTVLAPFAARRAEHPDRAALVEADGSVLTYAALDEWAAALAARYERAGIGPGSRVLVALGLSPALYAVLIALWRLGAVAVFPEPAAGLAGLRHALAATRPAAFVGPRWLGLIAAGLASRPGLAMPLTTTRGREAARAMPAWPEDHPALISFTSGSTGRPKGILRSHGFLLRQQQALAPLLQPAAPSRDLVCLPLFVLAGLGFGTTSILPAASLHRPASIDARTLAAQIEHSGATRLLAPPSIAGTLAAEPEFGRLHEIFTGGGPVWPDLMRRLLQAAPGARIFAVYGSTEAEPIAHQALHRLTADDWAEMEAGGGLLGGTPVADIAVRIVDDEIQVAGAHVNRGYLDTSQDAANKVREGATIWHRTGDAGRLGPDGRLWLLGRLDGRAGLWYPFAVEVAARGWPGVVQAALIGDSGRPMLVLAGNRDHEPVWSEQIKRFPGLELHTLPRIPLDRRHQAKVDYAELKRALSAKH
ncbi:MAG TPA: AMP-binding protein [Aliidongia sp.]|nr:AMP-binding protein [Aliidongia sp.]